MTSAFGAFVSSSADWRALVDKVGAAAVASYLSPTALAEAVLADTALAAALVDTRPMPASFVAAFPDVEALAAPAPPQVEHDPPSHARSPLVEHIVRLLGRKLAGLERGDIEQFHGRVESRADSPTSSRTTAPRGLSSQAFDHLAAIARRVLDAGLGPALRAAILHLDIAKTTSESHRAAWLAGGTSLDIHNDAAATILRRFDRTRSWPMPAVHRKLAIAWVQAHGLAGQHVRGEGPMLMFAPLVGSLREMAPELGRGLGTPPDIATRLALDALHVLDACDTASVREGLLDDALLARLARVRDQLVIAAAQAPFATPEASLAALAPAPDRQQLATRLRALRADRQAVGEPGEVVDRAVAAIGDAELVALAPALATCQLWYCEAATSGLSPSAQLGVLATAVGAARKLGVDVTRPWHAQLRPLVGQLHGDAPGARYRRRLVEAALAQRSVRELLTGAPAGPLGTLSTRLAAAGDDDAIVVDYLETPESSSLVTLLGIYETRSQVQFHAMLKALCDLYGLRKDDLDRVNNEASYLASMNAARSDKQRMLDLVVPGRIVEIGPGGGIVLDLLEARFADSEIVGVDLSKEVVEALGERARAGQHRWRVIHGAAEQLGELVDGATTVVLCSILHEVFSYTEPRFSLDSVAEVLRAAFEVLVPGGRIVIRDGVMPPPATRRIRFIASDARETFALYVAQFEGRPIRHRELSPDRVELSAADAMEFLYTYTWGPASFPYEVREQYGVLTYEDYVAHIRDWLGPAAEIVDVGELRSYLQPGYREHLATKIELTDEHDRIVELPDSNCLIAIAKRGPR